LAAGAAGGIGAALGILGGHAMFWPGVVGVSVAASSTVAVGGVSYSGRQVSMQVNSKLMEAINQLTEEITHKPRTLDEILDALDASHSFQLKFNEFLRMCFDSCPVCLNEYSMSQALAKPDNPLCHHIFHYDCLEAVTPMKCPCCRRDFEGLERVKIEYES